MRKLEIEITAGMLSNTYHSLSKYPVYYDGKYWLKSDCDNVFNTLYSDRRCTLNTAGGVYMTEGLWVFPDGKIYEW